MSKWLLQKGIRWLWHENNQSTKNLVIPLAVSALVFKYPGNFSFLKISPISEICDIISWSKMKV